MNILDQLKQNLTIAIIIIVSGVVAAAWKVFHSLYVSPRDFRIASMKDDMAKLQEELNQLRKAHERFASHHSEVQQGQIGSELRVADTPTAPPTLNKAQQEKDSDSPLSSLRICHAMWSDENQTKLQKQKFEADLKGKEVSWAVDVDSVSEIQYETIRLYVSEATGGWDAARAAAEFPATQQNLLLGLKKGDQIILHGEIKEFFLWPSLINCKIESVA